MVRARKKDLLMILLLCLSVVFTIYCTVGLPYLVAKLTLLTYSMPTRLAPILGVLQIILLVRSVALMQDEDCFVPRLPAILAAVALSGVTMYLCLRYFEIPNYLSLRYSLVLFVLIAFWAFCFMAKCPQRVPAERHAAVYRL